ncbi:MAG: lipoyl(octanoyl) transferase [Candidatus Tokpelaia sp. JSC161]|jgi:lipoyl(octanoyl) transferase|nr:MAG: lipoyl(octanoyl) transferase [Candidatus Tokpelaia sp. JSC161]
MKKKAHFLLKDNLKHTFLPTNSSQTVEWRVENKRIHYLTAISFMEERVKKIYNHQADELIWLVEHPPLYTAGVSAKPKDLLSKPFPIYYTNRGGQFTYHGPGQRVIYVMLDLKSRKEDIHAFISALEEWGIHALAKVKITGVRRKKRIGIWIPRSTPSVNQNLLKEDKIAAIGIRLWKWISFHGMAININPCLEHYKGIIPCGMPEHGITSLKKIGLSITMAEFDLALRTTFNKIFGHCHSTLL